MFAISLRSINGDCAFLSISINPTNEAVPSIAKERVIIAEYVLLSKLDPADEAIELAPCGCKNVNTSKMEIIAIPNVTAPLISRGCLLRPALASHRSITAFLFDGKFQVFIIF